MFKVFSFGFETCNKTISSLIYRLINEALLVADHISIRCCFSSWTYLVGSDKHVLAFRFQSVFPGAGVLVWLPRDAMHNNNNNNKHDNVYGAVIMAEPLREFTRFI